MELFAEYLPLLQEQFVYDCGWYQFNGNYWVKIQNHNNQRKYVSFAVLPING